MRIPKATPRENGSHMVTLKLDFHLNAHDIFAILMSNVPLSGNSSDGYEADYSDLPVSKVAEIIRDHLYDYGNGEWDVADWVPADQWRKSVRWASRQMTRTFPDIPIVDVVLAQESYKPSKYEGAFDDE